MDVAEKLGGNVVVKAQVHAGGRGKAGGVKNSDGIFSTNTNLVCSIQVADCLPLFFVHGFKPVAGLVHAGWRGLARGIIRNIKTVSFKYHSCPTCY